MLADSAFPNDRPEFHLSVLVVNGQISRIQEKMTESKILLKEPLCVKVIGIGSLTTRAGQPLTVLQVEHAPCANLKHQLVNAFVLFLVI